MAGRGRGMTLPAWMTAEQAAPAAAPPPPQASYGSYNQNNGGGGYDGRYDNSSYDPYAATAASPNPHHSHHHYHSAPPSVTASHASGPPMSQPPRRSASPDAHRSRHRSRSREKDRGHSKRSSERSSSRRDRSRSRSREKRRDRSASPGGDGKKWVSKRKGKPSNFDVRPADGQVLPPIMGLGSNLNPAVKLAPDGSIMMSGPAGAVVNNQVTRHARRLYVGGIPPNSTENDIANFFRHVISQSLSPRELDNKDPVVSVFINREKSFAFVELQTIELTTACCKLDGMSYAGNPLRIRRPNDYQPDRVPAELGPIPTISLSALGVVSTTVPDGPNKIFVGGIPHELGEEEIKELLTAFGPLRAFHLVKEPGSNVSKGYAFCEYADPKNTNIAIMGLHNLAVCDKTLTVKPASQNATPTMPSGPASIYGPASGGGNSYGSSAYGPSGGGGGGYGAPDYSTPTRVLLLKNLVDKNEIQDDNEHFDILDDVKSECSQHGHVRSVIIPRVKDGYPVSAEGSVFVEFGDVESAKRASQSLKGRKFADRMVLADYYDEIKFSNRVLL